MRLKELREINMKTQIEISNFLNIKQNTYSQYETCQRQIPINLLIKLSQFYNVSVDYILGLTDVDIPYPRQ
ncbi:MAG: helix-turn-helix transcriptional regulator [Clostridia bacterium]|nr:helix-turn-helix transcriptional regulator [Clostridia bacterium]